MEVHQHSHHNGKKSWKTYFWEFFMLFLAVFCGFLAEYQLEHLIEHQRERSYIRSMIEDISQDTIEIKEVINFNIDKFRGMDSLIILLNTSQINSDDERQLYKLNRKYAANIYTMIFGDRTMRQLINSGNMRLIRKQGTADSILNYYGQPKDDIMGQEEVYVEMSKRLLFTAEDIFDHQFSALKMDSNNDFYRSKPQAEIRLLTHDGKTIKKYAQMVSTAQGMLSVYLNLLLEMKQRAERLLIYLEHEY
jgi:hypothetical protein